MLELILFSIGVVGFGLASYFDLRYTEFADWLPYGMIVSALGLRGVFAFLSGNFLILTNSLTFGLLFLGLGAILYFTKQWGDGDAWLLGAMGFLFPDKESMVFLNGYSSVVPFHLAFIFNLFLISLFYIVVYSLFLGAKNKEVRKEFSLTLKKNRKGIFSMSAVFLGSVLVFSLYFGYLHSAYSVLLPFYGISGLIYLFFFFVHYTKAIEKKVFRKKISVNEIKEGDVLVGNKWKGITKSEIKKIKGKKFVYVKEGVRFAPVFLINVLVTSLYGGMLFL